MGNGATLSDIQFYLNLLLAIFLGAVIGLERQWRQRLAGLRTNALVSAGAALYIMLTDAGTISGDATRIPAQIVSGVGFLGAGVIMKEGISIRGLNTAATLWCSAAVGSLAGLGLLHKSAFATLAILGTNLLLRPVAQLVNRRRVEPEEQEMSYLIVVVCRESEEFQVRHLLLQAVSTSKLILHSLHSEQVPDSIEVEVKAEVDMQGKGQNIMEQIVSRLGSEKGVSAVTWRQLRAE